MVYFYILEYIIGVIKGYNSIVIIDIVVVYCLILRYIIVIDFDYIIVINCIVIFSFVLKDIVVIDLN